MSSPRARSTLGGSPPHRIAVAVEHLFERIRHAEPVNESTSSRPCVGSLDGRYFTQDRFTVLHDRMADPSRAAEVVVEPSATLSGLHVGERRDLGTWDDKDPQSSTFFQHPTAPKDKLTVTIVGIGGLRRRSHPRRSGPATPHPDDPRVRTADL